MNDRQLLDQFESCTLPFDQWTHRTHVKVAYLYVCAHPLEQAIVRMREGIKAYNAANGVTEGPHVGYDETTTQAFVRIIDAERRAYGDTCPVSDADGFCEMHPHLLCKHILRLFYSPGRRRHPDAKTTFVEPDLAPLPRWPAPPRDAEAAGDSS